MATSMLMATSVSPRETVSSHLKLDFKFAERLYLSNDFGKGVVGPSTVYFEATSVFSGFCEGRAQQIPASGVIAMCNQDV